MECVCNMKPIKLIVSEISFGNKLGQTGRQFSSPYFVEREKIDSELQTEGHDPQKISARIIKSSCSQGLYYLDRPGNNLSGAVSYTIRTNLDVAAFGMDKSRAPLF